MYPLFSMEPRSPVDVKQAGDDDDLFYLSQKLYKDKNLNSLSIYRHISPLL